jgi:hypothetical protein
MGGDALHKISLSPSSLNDISAWKVETLETKLNWPNQVTLVPESVFGSEHISVGTGFLVPGRSTGYVQVIDPESGKLKTLSSKKEGYFYHRVLWHDMNNDGRLDAVSARGKKPIMGATDGELVWLEQPADLQQTGPWKEHLIARGPDVNFLIEDLDGDGSVEIVATEFFAKKLSLHWQEQGSWVSRTLDDTLGAAFDLEWTDLNGDGRKDLLVTNHEGSAAKAAIFAYEIPQSPKIQKWTRHSLLTSIKTEKGGLNQASPGSAFAIYPNTKAKGQKPWIVAGGDGSTKVHALVPTAQDWVYKELVLLDTESTIGTIATGDIDGDGSVEVLAPSYDEGKIYVLGLDGI